MYSEISKTDKLLFSIQRKLIAFLEGNQVSYDSIQYQSSYLNRKGIKPIHQIRVSVDDSIDLGSYRSKLLRKLSRSGAFANSSYLTTEGVERRLSKGRVDMSSMGHVYFEKDSNHIIITFRSTSNSFYRAREFENKVLKELGAKKGAITCGSKYGSILEYYKRDKKSSPEVLFKEDLLSNLNKEELGNLLVNTVSDATVILDNRVYCVSMKEFTEKTVRIANYNLRYTDDRSEFMRLMNNGKYLTNFIKNSFRKNYIFCIRSNEKLYLYKFNGFGDDFKITNKKPVKNGISFDLNGIPCKVLIRREDKRDVWKMELVVRVSDGDIDGYCKSIGCKKIGNELDNIFDGNGKWSSFRI